MCGGIYSSSISFRWKKKKEKKKKRKKLFVYSSLRNVFPSTQPINSRFVTVFVTFSKFNLSRTSTTKFSENIYAWYSVSYKEYKLRRKMITFIHVIMLYSPLGSIEIGSKFSHDPLRNIQFFISFQSQTGESTKTSRRRIIICTWVVKGALSGQHNPLYSVFFRNYSLCFSSRLNFGEEIICTWQNHTFTTKKQGSRELYLNYQTKEMDYLKNAGLNTFQITSVAFFSLFIKFVHPCLLNWICCLLQIFPYRFISVYFLYFAHFVSK